MDLSRLTLYKCVDLDVPINNLEDMGIKVCKGAYTTRRGEERPALVIQATLYRYAFSDYETYDESLILIQSGKRTYSTIIKERVPFLVYDVPVEPEEVKIFNQELYFGNSKRAIKIKRELFYNLDEFLSKYEEPLEEKDRNKLLFYVSPALSYRYRRAIRENL